MKILNFDLLDMYMYFCVLFDIFKLIFNYHGQFLNFLFFLLFFSLYHFYFLSHASKWLQRSFREDVCSTVILLFADLMIKENCLLPFSPLLLFTLVFLRSMILKQKNGSIKHCLTLFCVDMYQLTTLQCFEILWMNVGNYFVH